MVYCICRAETLHARMRGEKLCDLVSILCTCLVPFFGMSYVVILLIPHDVEFCQNFKDLDGALHGRLHNKDEELQNRVYNVVYTLIRCGRIDEVTL